MRNKEETYWLSSDGEHLRILEPVDTLDIFEPIGCSHKMWWYADWIEAWQYDPVPYDVAPYRNKNYLKGWDKI